MIIIIPLRIFVRVVDQRSMNNITINYYRINDPSIREFEELRTSMKEWNLLMYNYTISINLLMHSLRNVCQMYTMKNY